MGWTTETALGENRRKFISEHQLRLRDIDVPIIIRLYESIDGERVEFEQSHYIKTPLRMEPYRTGQSWGVDEKNALLRAMRTINEPYDEAIRQGYSPSEAWIVPNELFSQ